VQEVLLVLMEMAPKAGQRQVVLAIMDRAVLVVRQITMGQATATAVAVAVTALLPAGLGVAPVAVVVAVRT
jgi:hypothetical protein